MSEDFFDRVGTAACRKDVLTTSPQPVDPEQQRDFGSSRWSAHEGKYWGSSQTIDRLPPGLYRCGQSPNIGYFLDWMVNDTDTLLRLPDSQVEEVLREITEFSTLKPAFIQRGFLYKRGILLWGPPGSGKTCCLRLLIQMVIEQMGGIAIFVDHPGATSGCLQLARKIEPHRQIIAILEDLDAPDRHASTLSVTSGCRLPPRVAHTYLPKNLHCRPIRWRCTCLIAMGAPSPTFGSWSS